MSNISLREFYCIIEGPHILVLSYELCKNRKTYRKLFPKQNCEVDCIWFPFHSTTSAVMQVYLKSVLESFLHPQPSVRMAALHVVNLILRQGLVHPVQVGRVAH